VTQHLCSKVRVRLAWMISRLCDRVSAHAEHVAWAAGEWAIDVDRRYQLDSAWSEEEDDRD